MARAPELSRTQPAARAQAPGSPASLRTARLEGPGEKVTVHLLLHSMSEDHLEADHRPSRTPNSHANGHELMFTCANSRPLSFALTVSH